MVLIDNDLNVTQHIAPRKGVTTSMENASVHQIDRYDDDWRRQKHNVGDSPRDSAAAYQSTSETRTTGDIGEAP